MSAGKLNHSGSDQLTGSTYSLVDYNRAGQALLEIVSEPDMRSGPDAAAYGAELRRIMVFLGVSDGEMSVSSTSANQLHFNHQAMTYSATGFCQALCAHSMFGHVLASCKGWLRSPLILWMQGCCDACVPFDMLISSGYCYAHSCCLMSAWLHLPGVSHAWCQLDSTELKMLVWLLVFQVGSMRCNGWVCWSISFKWN